MFLFNCTNSLIKWEDWSEQSSSSLEQYYESYKSVVFKLKSIRDSILWIILSTFYHIYINWDLLIAQVADVILVVTLSMRFSFYWDTRWYFWGGKGLSYFCGFFYLKETDDTLLVYLIGEPDGSRLEFFLVEKTGCIIVILIWIKFYMPDIIKCDKL